MVFINDLIFLIKNKTTKLMHMTKTKTVFVSEKNENILDNCDPIRTNIKLYRKVGKTLQTFTLFTISVN